MKKKKQISSPKKDNGVKPSSNEGESTQKITYSIVKNQEQAIALSESEMANVGKE